MVRKVLLLILLMLMSLCLVENIRVGLLDKVFYPILHAHAVKHNDFGLYVKCGQIKYAAAKYDEAKQDYAVVLQHARTSENKRYKLLAYYYLGNVFYQTEDYENALKAYAAVLKNDAGNRKALKKFSRIMMAKGEYAQLYPFVSAYIKTKPRDSFGYAERCAILTRLEKYSYARAACEKAISLRKGDARAHYDYAVLLEQQGFDKLAEDEYKLAQGNQRNIKSREELEEMLNIKPVQPADLFGF